MAEGVGKVLLIGYGNPGRLDDGLGPVLAEAIEKLNIPDITVDAAYQLSVEDASAVAEHEVVIFADADVSGPEPFGFKQIEPKQALSFSSHSVEPEVLLDLAHRLFKASTKGYVLGIRGYCFNEFSEVLSDKAKANLTAAIAFTESLLRDRCFGDAVSKAEEFSVNGAGFLSEDETCKTKNM